MGWTAGIFTRERGPETWRSDATAGVKIKADLHDISDNDLAAGINMTLTKDGQNSPTADINWNGYKIVNLGAPVNPTDAVTKAYIDADAVHALPLKEALSIADELLISNSTSTPPWQRAKTTVLALRGVPVGAGTDYWGPTAPPGWVFAFGQAISRTVYADLYLVLGDAYGAGNGSTTFNVPDKRGNVSAGADAMGGTAAGRLPGWVPGTMGGENGVRLEIVHMPYHNHGGITDWQNADHGHTGSTNNAGAHTHSLTVGIPIGSSGGNYGMNTQGAAGFANIAGVGDHAHSFSTGGVTANHKHGIYPEGGGGHHNNTQPTIACNYIIYTGVMTP